MENKNYERIESLIEPWKIEKELGAGAYGKVFKIVREEFGNRYEAALKMITIPQNKSEVDSIMSDGLSFEGATEYFKRFVEEITSECALMSKFKGNSNIVSYEDHKVVPHADSIGWDIFIRMELLTPLLTYTMNNPLSEEKVIQLGIDICKALELCKSHNVIHRDIKPENIFVSSDNKFKLGDFGIARTIEKTMGGLSKKGTISYMAPEVYREEEYNYSVDIYSLGIVMYRFLNNNRTPFLSPTAQTITYEEREIAKKRRIKGEIIPRPVNGSNKLVDIVLKACSYDPKNRFQSPTTMRQALEALLNGTDYVEPMEITQGLTDVDFIDSTEAMPTGNGMFTDKQHDGHTEQTVADDSIIEQTQAVDIDKNQDKPKKKKKSKAWIVILIVVALIAAIAACAIVFFKPKKEEEVAPAVVIENAIELEFTPAITSLESDVEKSAEIIEDRIKVLGDKYTIEQTDKTIKVQIASELLGESAEEAEYIVNLLAAKGSLEVAYYSSYVTLDEESLENLTIESENKADFADYYEEGLCLENEYNAFTDIFDEIADAKDIYYLRAELSESNSDKFQEIVDEQTVYEPDLATNLSARMDTVVLDDTIIVSYLTLGAAAEYKTGDSDEVCIVSNYADNETIVELLKYVVTSEKLPIEFNWKLIDTVEMETGDAVTGKNQKENIEGKYVALEYVLDEYNSIEDDEEYQGLVDRTKKRLDILEEPYAIGYTGIDKRTLVVKISPEVLGIDFMRLIGEIPNVELYNQSGLVQLAYELKISKDQAGKPCFTYSDKYGQDVLQAIPQGEKLYLVVNDVTVAETTMPALTEFTDEITIDFSDCTFINDYEFSSDDSRLMKFIAKCSENDDELYFDDLTINDVKYYDGDELLDEEIPWGYDCLTGVDKETLNWIQMVCDEATATKAYSERNAIKVELDLKPGDDLAQEFTSRVKEIYTQCDLGNGSYQRIDFYIKDETEKSVTDRCRIGFMKSNYSDMGEDVLMYGYYYVTGPTFEKYGEDFENIFASDPFYIEFFGV